MRTKQTFKPAVDGLESREVLSHASHLATIAATVVRPGTAPFLLPPTTATPPQRILNASPGTGFTNPFTRGTAPFLLPPTTATPPQRILNGGFNTGVTSGQTFNTNPFARFGAVNGFNTNLTGGRGVFTGNYLLGNGSGAFTGITRGAGNNIFM